jgi:GLPGLI family protein
MVSGAIAQELALSGHITFERTENMHKQLSDGSSWSEEMKKRVPKYRVDQFQLSFNTRGSLYKVIREDESTFASWWRVAYKNTVKTDLVRQQFEESKNVYERDYRISDSLPACQWKLMGEYREVAGYNCRKATTIIMDSVYIIAFYTDEIPVSGGPELFSGLPGMILGVVVPRLNLTYFATKVDKIPPGETELVLPPMQKKEKTVDIRSFSEEIRKAVKDWGNDANKIYWKAML